MKESMNELQVKKPLINWLQNNVAEQMFAWWKFLEMNPIFENDELVNPQGALKNQSFLVIF